MVRGETPIVWNTGGVIEQLAQRDSIRAGNAWKPASESVVQGQPPLVPQLKQQRGVNVFVML